jgi:hypothetical protein
VAAHQHHVLAQFRLQLHTHLNLRHKQHGSSQMVEPCGTSCWLQRSQTYAKGSMDSALLDANLRVQYSLQQTWPRIIC